MDKDLFNRFENNEFPRTEEEEIESEFVETFKKKFSTKRPLGTGYHQFVETQYLAPHEVYENQILRKFNQVATTSAKLKALKVGGKLSFIAVAATLLGVGAAKLELTGSECQRELENGHKLLTNIRSQRLYLASIQATTLNSL